MKNTILATAVALLFVWSCGQIKSKENPKVQLIRNATLVIDYAGKKILIDPMFSQKGAISSFAGIEKNPTVELPMPIADIIKNIDLVIVSHTHQDHFDKPASAALNKAIPLIVQPADEGFFKKEGFTNATVLQEQQTWNGITIHREDGQHGTGTVLKQMGKTSGFILQAENQPTIYILGDTVLTEDVLNAIEKFEPDYIIVNSGGAVIKSLGESPILMNEDQTMKLIVASGKAKVIAVHMNALDHCFTTRAVLKKKADELNISSNNLIIPEDGEIINLKSF